MEINVRRRQIDEFRDLKRAESFASRKCAIFFLIITFFFLPPSILFRFAQKATITGDWKGLQKGKLIYPVLSVAKC